MAEMAGVSLRTLKNWREEGVDISDDEAVMARAAEMEGREDASESYNDARTRKLRAEADLKEHQLQVERGLYVSREAQLSEGMKKGQAIKNVFLKMEAELTPLVAGREAPEVARIIHKWSREKLVELSRYDDGVPISAD